jgi:cation:H+ antiporter
LTTNVSIAEILDLLRLFGGFVYLLLGGDLLVRGALGLSKRSNIPPAIVGLTVVAMGTSAPELMVSSFSALSGYPSIAVGNVVGSNIANVLLVLGVPVLIHPIVCNEESLLKQTGFMIGVSLLFIVLCFLSPIGRGSGIFLLSLLMCFLILTMRGAAVIPMDDPVEELERGLGLPDRRWAIGLFILLGGVMLPSGASLAVEGAIGLAGSWGVSEAVIGLSLIALGTSLPELSTTVIAALHRSSEVALGNVIGSNLFNILAVMGFTAVLVPLPVEESILRYDLWVMFGASIMLWVFVLARGTIGRWWGVAFLGGYVSYLVSIF